MVSSCEKMVSLVDIDDISNLLLNYKYVLLYNKLFWKTRNRLDNCQKATFTSATVSSDYRRLNTQALRWSPGHRSRHYLRTL